jgi:hypothetical protein
VDAAIRHKILELLDTHRTMTVATLRPDGWPQATRVGAVKEGRVLGFLCATLLPERRRWSHVVLLLGSVLAAVMPAAHMLGKGLSPVAASPGGHFFVWTLFALGVSGGFGVVLSIRAMWGLRRGVA